MAIGMSDGKVDRIGLYFRQRLGSGWEFEPYDSARYCYGAVIARRGDLKVVLEVSYTPLLRISVVGRKADSREDIVPLPLLAAETTGALAASIAWAISRAREWRETEDAL